MVFENLVHYERNVAVYFTLVNDNIFYEPVEDDDRPSFFIHKKYPAVKLFNVRSR